MKINHQEDSINNWKMAQQINTKINWRSLATHFYALANVNLYPKTEHTEFILLGQVATQLSFGCIE